MELDELCIDYDTARIGPLTASLKPGHVTVLQGASGSGKTSLCLAMTGFLSPSSGRISGNLGVLVPQNPREWLNPRHTVAQVLDRTLRIRAAHADQTARSHSGRSGAGGARESVGARERSAFDAAGERDAILAQALLSPAISDHRCGELSGGQAARVCIARALASGIDTMVCDEPTAALDSSNAARIAWLINDLAAAGRTLVWATHDLDLVAATDRGYSFITL